MYKENKREHKQYSLMLRRKQKVQVSDTTMMNNGQQLVQKIFSSCLRL